MSYPPDEHVLRDLRIESWLEAEDHSVAELPVVDAVLDRSGAAALGVLVTLVDIACARVAFRGVHPHWLATADLSLSLAEPLPVGATARAEAWMLKAGSKLVSVAVDLGRAGRGVATFARIPREASLVDRPLPQVGERMTMPASGPPLERHVIQRMGMRHTEGGAVLDMHEYVSNSFGTINGGVLGFLVTAAAEDATGGVGSDVTLRYVGQTKVGPALARATVIRSDVCEVRVVDRGNGDALLATAMVSTARAAD